MIEQRWPRIGCQIGAQSHLRAFYERHSFAVNGDPYVEDGIPHLPMRRPG